MFLSITLFSSSLHTTSSNNIAQKANGKEDSTDTPNGLSSIKHRLSIIWKTGVVSGWMDPCRFVAATSAMAARIFNIYPKKVRS